MMRGSPRMAGGFEILQVNTFPYGGAMYTLQVQRIDDELVVPLPGRVLERMNVREGDKLYVTERDGAVFLAATPPAGATQPAG